MTDNNNFLSASINILTSDIKKTLDATNLVPGDFIEEEEIRQIKSGDGPEERDESYIVNLTNDGTDVLLKLTGASWEILRGERTVALRRDAAVTQSKASASKKGAKKTDDRDGQLPTEEARELFEALRALRRELAAARSAALYVIATDRTLLDLVRFRPQDMDGLARIYGLGESKRANYGARILELLAEHELAFGRPDDLPELPDAPVRPTTKELGPATETETTSLDLFREHGSVEAVAAARELKPSTIMGHLAQAVARGEITAREVALLPASEYDCVEDTVRTFNAEEIHELGRIFEALEKKYPYDILRCIRVELARATAESESTGET